jgi:transcription-repair coupling factor (superfamily II helicase)
MTSAPLESLPGLLRSEPGLTRALGEPDARLAVVEVARPIAIAALANLSNRQPLVVACPTGTMAAQLADDLMQFVPEDDVALFPGWETLPFERVSPSVETMGQRLKVLWRLGNEDRAPKIIVAGVRALLQKLGPGSTTVEPIITPIASLLNSSSSVTAEKNWSSIAASSHDAVQFLTSTPRQPTPQFASTCGATRSSGSRVSV